MNNKCTCIKIKTVDQRLTVVQQPILASGDVDSVRVEYALDSHWTGYTPSATFYTGAKPEDVYEQLLDDGACIIPWEVLQSDGILFIGLRGVDGSGLIKTAAPVRYRVEKGSPVGTATTAGPSPDIYQQLLTLLISDGVGGIEVKEIEGGQRITVHGVDVDTIFDLMHGESITVESITESGEDGKFNVVTFSDGTQLNVKNGTSGVYIGSDTPPANASVWIDPSGTPTGTEDWEFDLEDGTTEVKSVVVVS